MVRENRTGWAYALGGNSGHQLDDAWTHDMSDLIPWNGERDDGGELDAGLHDLWSVEHARLLLRESGSAV
jgi:hypothetical protein